MSLKGSWVVDHRRMIVTLHTDRLRTLQHVREFLEGNQEVDLVVATRAAAYGFIEQTLGRFDYVHQGKAEKGLLRCFLAKVTGLSRAQLTRLLAQHRVTGSIADGVVARIVTGPHDANRQDPHLPMRYDTGRPRVVIRFRISQPRTASLPCPAGLRARRPSPMMDL